MSSNRSSGRSHENEDFSLKLQELLSTNMKKKTKFSTTLILNSIYKPRLYGYPCCSFWMRFAVIFRGLMERFDDLSIRISELMASLDNNGSINADILRQLLQH
ncbi:hypothetical protein Goshw_015711 [Gossypium schwendimanii]|uniref:Uncharacterized protein n=1 Tax=Gossypium schwendimanii TaxID=34291 RepID=A0A7J9KLE3_GOSSC|nr:hypothetical protein [Gossypium schwendimanii]